MAPSSPSASAFRLASWLNCDFDWRNHNIIVWNHDHPRPPNWWHQPPRQRNMGHTTVWHPVNRPGAIGVNRGDRGWGAPNNQPVVATVSRSVSDSVMPRRTPAPAVRPEAPATRSSMPVARPAPAPVQRVESISRPESNGAFIGVQSAHDTKTYSDRGQESMQTVTRSAPVSRPAMPSGGGGGGHGSGPSRH